MRSRVAYLALFIFTAFVLRAPAAAADGVVIEDTQYADNAAAQAAWSPMRQTPPAEAVVVNGTKALRFNCNFAATAAERVSWDRKVQLNLESCQGVELKVLCRETTPVSYFSIYFQSGEGWYHGAFFPESASGWNTIAIEKSAMTAEGQPAGWGQISAIRISAWRAKDANTEFYIGGLRKTGLLGVDALVAIVRADSAAQRQPGEARSIEQYTKGIVQQFDAVHVGSVVISDLDLTANQIRDAALVVLPYNPFMGDRTQRELLRYLERGGKLLAFYTMPERLGAFLGLAPGRHMKAEHPGQFSSIRVRNGALPGAPSVVQQQSWNIVSFTTLPKGAQVLADWEDDQGHSTAFPAVLGNSRFLLMTHVLLPGDAPNKSQMLLAMAGYLAPALWRQAALAGLDRIGAIGAFKSFDDAAAGIAQLSSQNAVTNCLALARQEREAARSLLSQEKYPAAIEHAAAADREIKEAFCRAQRPAAGEFRAFWCHSAFGVEGLDWDEAVRRLAENGFTAVLPNMLWGGVAFYNSEILPVAPQVASRGDQVAQCLAACRKYGVELHVWKVNWNLGHAAPNEFVDRMRREGRLQASAQGKEEPWLCPSNPANQKLEIDSMVELVRRYPIDGIHFDYIRYPDADHCFCRGCRERFQRATHTLVRNWPGDILANGPGRTNWLEWRRENITAVVKAVSQQARAVRPGIKISAAVFPNWSTDRDSVGQDWQLWCERGYLDFVCPMDYTPSTGSFENMATRQLQWAGPVRCYPGIGLSASTSQFGVDRLIEQIQVTRRLHTGGFTVFNYGVAECKEILPLLGLGITRTVPRNR